MMKMKKPNHKEFKCPKCHGEFENPSVFRLHLARRYNIFVSNLSSDKIMKFVERRIKDERDLRNNN